MSRKLIKLGGFIGITLLTSFAVYNNLNKVNQKEVIDITVDVTEEKQK